MSKDFEAWREQFEQTPEYLADSFHWADMAKEAFEAGHEQGARDMRERCAKKLKSRLEIFKNTPSLEACIRNWILDHLGEVLEDIRALPLTDSGEEEVKIDEEKIYLAADLEEAKERLRQIEQVVNATPELNMSNFDIGQGA